LPAAPTVSYTLLDGSRRSAQAQRGFDTITVAMKSDPPAYASRFAPSRAPPFGVALDKLVGELLAES
jgi:hypothetical protein